MKQVFVALLAIFVLTGMASAVHTANITTNATDMWLGAPGMDSMVVNFTIWNETGGVGIKNISIWHEVPQFNITIGEIYFCDSFGDCDLGSTPDWHPPEFLDSNEDENINMVNITGDSGALPTDEYLVLGLQLEPLESGNITWHMLTEDVNDDTHLAETHLALDINPPLFFEDGWNVSSPVNSTAGGDTFANASATWEDAHSGLDYCWMESNETGVWEEHSYKASCDGYADYILDFSLHPNKTVCFRSHANDSVGFMNTTADHCLTSAPYETEVYDVSADLPTYYNETHEFYYRWRYTNGTEITTADYAEVEINGTDYPASYVSGQWNATLAPHSLAAGYYEWNVFIEKENHQDGETAPIGFNVLPTQTQVTGIGDSGPDKYNETHLFYAEYRYGNGTAIAEADTAEFEFNGTENHTASWSSGNSRWELTIGAHELAVGTYNWIPFFELTNHETGIGVEQTFIVEPTPTQVVYVGSTTPAEYSEEHLLWASYQYGNGTDITVADFANFTFDGTIYPANWNGTSERWEATIPAESIIPGTYDWNATFELENHEDGLGPTLIYNVVKTSTNVVEESSTSPAEYSDNHTLSASYRYSNGTPITSVDKAAFNFSGTNYTAEWNGTSERWEAIVPAEAFGVGEHKWIPYFERAHYETGIGVEQTYVIEPTSTQIGYPGSTTPSEYSDNHTLWASYQQLDGTNITEADVKIFWFGDSQQSMEWNGTSGRWEAVIPAESYGVGEYNWNVTFNLANYSEVSSGNFTYEILPTSTQLSADSTTPAEYSDSHTFWANYEDLDGQNITGLGEYDRNFTIAGLNYTAEWNGTSWVVELPARSLVPGPYEWNATFLRDNFESQVTSTYTYLVDITSTQVVGEGSSSPAAYFFSHDFWANYQYTNGTDITNASDVVATFEIAGDNHSAYWSDENNRWQSGLLPDSLAEGSYNWTPYFELQYYQTGIGGVNEYVVVNQSHTSNFTANVTDWINDTDPIVINFKIWNEETSTRSIADISILQHMEQFNITDVVYFCNSTGNCDMIPANWNEPVYDDPLVDDLNTKIDISSNGYLLEANDYVVLGLELVPYADGDAVWSLRTTDTGDEHGSPFTSDPTSIHIKLDRGAPQFHSDLIENGTRHGHCETSREVRMDWSDHPSGLDTVKIFHNASGSWVDVVLSGTNEFTYDLGAGLGGRVDYYFWANDTAGNENATDHANLHFLTPVYIERDPNEAFPTIQAALEAASTGEMIIVCQGTYSEALIFQDVENVTLRGIAQESVINPDGAISIPAGAKGATLEGLTVASGSNPLLSIAADDVTLYRNGFNYTTSGTAISVTAGNSLKIEQNRFDYDDTAVTFTPGTGVREGVVIYYNEFVATTPGSEAIIAGGLKDFNMSLNKFEKTVVQFGLVTGEDSDNLLLEHNGFTGPDSGAIEIFDHGSDQAGQLSNFTLRYNWFQNNTFGIKFDGGLVETQLDNDTISLSYNNFIRSSIGSNPDDKGVYVDAGDAILNATYNFWGNATGPAVAPETGVDRQTEIGLNVTFDPYFLEPGRATLRDDAQESIGSGEYNVTNKTELLISDPNAAPHIRIPKNVTDAKINFGGIVDDFDEDTGDFNVTFGGGLNMTATVDIRGQEKDVDVQIPPGTKVSGTNLGSMSMNMPRIRSTPSTAPTPTSGFTASTSSVIEIGFPEHKLSFDKAVRILIPGEAGRLVGYTRTGAAFTRITDTCANDTQVAGNLLPVDGNCKIDVGEDLVIWTRHFTEFVTYTQTEIEEEEEEEEETKRSSGWTFIAATDYFDHELEVSGPATVRAISGEEQTFSVVVKNSGEGDQTGVYMRLTPSWQSGSFSVEADSVRGWDYEDSNEIDLAEGEKILYVVTINTDEVGEHILYVAVGSNEVEEATKSFKLLVRDVEEPELIPVEPKPEPEPELDLEPETIASELDSMGAYISMLEGKLSEEGEAILSEAKTLYQQARTAYEEGDYARARQLLEAAQAKTNEATGLKTAEGVSTWLAVAVLLLFVGAAVYLDKLKKKGKKKKERD